MTRTLRAALAAAGLLCAAAAPASAAMVITGAQSGTDFVFTYSGTVDLTSGVSWLGPYGSTFSLIQPESGAFISVSGYDGYDLLYTGPAPTISFGASETVSATSRSGDSFGFGYEDIYVPLNYVSGDPINGTLTFVGMDMAGLGLTAGSQSFALPSGDTITMNIGAIDSGPGAEIPLPAAAPLLLAGLGLAGMVSRRRKG